MGKYTAYNLGVITKAIHGNDKIIGDEIVDDLDISLREFMRMYDGSIIPIDTGNLHDSTGIAVYSGGTLTRFLFDPIAEIPRDGFWGRNLLERAMSEPSLDYATGVSIVLFSTMPYNAEVNEWSHYFDVLCAELADFITMLYPDISASFTHNVKEMTQNIEWYN